MPKSKLNLRKVITSGLSFVVLALLAAFVPWHEVFKLLGGLKLSDLVTLLVMGCLYYAAKATRFWMMLKALGLERPISLISLLYLSAQPATFVPGGDFYRTVLLKEHADIPMHRSSSAIVLQAIVEATALIAVGLVGAIVSGEQIGPVLVVSALFAVIIICLSKGWVPTNPKLLNRLPLVKISRVKLRQFKSDNQMLLKPAVFIRLFGISLAPILAGVVIVFISAQAVGVNFSWLQSIAAYALPAIIAYVAFLPGAGEGGSIGVLALLGTSIPSAVAITLLLRLFTVGLGLLLGPLATLTRRKVKMEAT